MRGPSLSPGAEAVPWPLIGRQLVVLAALATVIAACVLTARVIGTDPAAQIGQETLTTIYTPPENRAQAMMNQHDGQHFAALAQDPGLRRPGVFGGPGEQAYRAARPLFGWLAWAGSLGQGAVVEWVLIALSALSAGVLVLGAGMLGASFDRDLSRLLAVLALPGAVVQLAWAGLGDNLGTGLALGGWALWRADRRLPAVAAFVLAIWIRETLALVVVAVALGHLLERRPWRQVPILTVPAATYASWVLLVHRWTGAWPTEGGGGRLAPPWSGLAVGAEEWAVVDALFLVLGVVLCAAAVWRCPDPTLRILVGLYVILALGFGWNVWARWEDYSRVLLPAYAAGLVVLLPVVPKVPGRVQRFEAAG